MENLTNIVLGYLKIRNVLKGYDKTWDICNPCHACVPFIQNIPSRPQMKKKTTVLPQKGEKWDLTKPMHRSYGQQLIGYMNLKSQYLASDVHTHKTLAAITRKTSHL